MWKRAAIWGGLMFWGSLGACGDPPRPAVGDRHPELVQTFDVAAGTCGVARSITLLKGDLEIKGIARAPGGFVASGIRLPTREPGWLSLSADGVSQHQMFSGWTGTATVLADFPFATSVTELHPLLLTFAGLQYAGRLHAWPLDSPGTELDVGDHFDRGTTLVAFATSFDANRAAFAAQHPVTFAPHLLTLDSHGATDGQLTLPDETVTCLLAAPTEDSVAVAVLYTTPAPMLQIVAPGATPGGASRALAVNGCPLLQSDRLLTLAADVDGALQILVLTGGEILPALGNSPPMTALGSPPRWLSRRPDGGFTLLVSMDGRPRLVQVSVDGTLEWIVADLPPGDVIPSRAGELFIDVFEPDSAGSPRHRIVQITCNGVGFAPP